MDNNRKLTIEEFNSIKKEMQRIYREAESIEENKENNPNFNEQDFLRQFFNEYLSLQNLLLSSDLSDIPSEKYRDLPFLAATQNDVLDFSRTKANIDFDIVELDGNNFNFKNCNIKNLERFYSLKEEYFDDKTIRENQNIFLSSNFPTNFKEKYYNRTLSIEDFTNLTDSQIEEVSKKGIYKSPNGFENFKRCEETTNKMIEMLGLEKTVKLYKESPKDYQEIEKLSGLNRYVGTLLYRYLDENKIKPLLSNAEPKDIKNIVYNYIRNTLINTNVKINPQQFTEDFIKENNDIFLTDVNIPNEFRERYYNKQLTYEDIVNNLNIFEKFDYRNFMDDRNYDNYYIKELISKIDIKNFNYFIKEHRDVFEHLYYEHKLNEFIKYLNAAQNFENNLAIALQKYIHEWENKSIQERTNEDGSKSYMIDWAKSMNYDFKNHYDNFEELLNYTDKTFIINKRQFDAINALGIKNILKFEKETSIFSSKSFPFGSFLTSIGLDFYSHNNADAIFSTLEYIKALSKSSISDETLTEKVFNIFLQSEEANKITVNAIQKYGKYIPILANKNVKVDGNFNVIDNDKIIDFQEYYIKKFGKEKFLNLIAKYGQYSTKLNGDYFDLSDNTNDISIEANLCNCVVNKIIKDPEWVFLANLYSELDVNEASKRKFHIYNIIRKYNNEGVTNIVKDCIKGNNYDDDKIETLVNIAAKIINSNSSELKNHARAMLTEIIKSNNPEKSYEKVENIFIKNNLPTVGKVFLTFETLHPNLSGFYFNDASMVSPILKSKSIRGRETIIFSDLIKSAVKSNNRAMREYIDNIKKGSYLFNKVASNNIRLNDLDNAQQTLLNTFISHLDTLYDHTIKGKNNAYNQNMNLNDKINFYINNLNISEKGNIGDRLVSMFCHFAGFDSVDSLEKTMDDSINKANNKNRERIRKNKEILETGDFIKGIGDIKYLSNILQNGSVAKEYLGSDAGSDSTPLDTDVTMINKHLRISDTISSSYSRSWGPIWLILKNDDRFILTRDKNGEITSPKNINDIMNKLEVFKTSVGDDTYGIRTAFASSNIDYIVTAGIDDRIGVEVAKNGFYIPVVDKETEKVIFTPDDYDNLRSKMQGLSYYGTSEYHVSSNLETDEIDKIASALEQSKEENKRNREAINITLRDALNTVNLSLKDTIDKKLETGTVELIDTGSTGRDTNLPGDGDYDFIMRLDREIISDPVKLENVKDALIKQLGIEHKGEVLNGNFRFKNVNIEGIDKTIDIDITFIPKTDKLEYSSDEALKDRFNSIKEQSSDKYNLVISNVIEAKKILKEAEVYKKQQGGISGIGIENWVLQSGGSFHDAATSFVEASKNKSVEEFKASYAIWDFGENHYADEKGIYKHDNFIDNLTADGYDKMKQVLTMYLIRERQKEDIKDILKLDNESEKSIVTSTTMFH